MFERSAFQLCSVDVWDTLLRRGCHPDAVKLHGANTLLLRCHAAIAAPLRQPRALLALRLEIERELARRARAAGGDEEYLLSEVLAEWLARACPQLQNPADLVRDLEEEEWQHELFVSYVDPAIDAGLAGLRAQRWIFLSDFYMPAQRLASLLTAKGIGWRFEGGFSSGEMRVNKRSGRLFSRVQDLYGVGARQYCHVGDNALSDVKVPRRLGMTARRYGNRGEESLRRRRAGYLHDRRQLYAALDKQCRRALDKAGGLPGRARRYGVKLAPLFAGFALHLFENARRDRLQRLYFCTREGELFARAYAVMTQAYPRLGGTVPVAEVLQVSRLSTFAASLEPPWPEAMMRLWAAYPRQSMGAWGLSLGLPLPLVQGWCGKFSMTLDQEIDRPWEDPRVVRLLADAEVGQILQRHCAGRRGELKAYLRSLIVPEEGSVGLVDIGWRGSIQDNLARLVPGVQWHGYYLGLQRARSPAPANAGKSAFGVDLNLDFPPTRRGPAKAGPAKMFANLPLLEMLCNCPGGSVTGYRPDPAGAVAVLRCADADEDAVHHEVIRYVQEGILSGVGIWAEAIHLHALHSGELRPLALRRWADLVRSPPRFLRLALQRLKHNELFGRGRFAWPEPPSGWRRQCAGVRAAGPASAASPPPPAAVPQAASGGDIP